MLTAQQFMELMMELKEQTKEILLLRKQLNEMHIIIARRDFE
jgi:hypothetical protein